VLLIDDRLRFLGIELPKPSTPGANYVPYVRSGDLVFLTGQLPQWNGERKYIGKVGREFSVDEGKKAARMCALNLIAHLRVALDGDLDKVVRCVRITGFVNSAPDFYAHPQVINGASDVLVDVFGDAGRHARLSVGVAALPYDQAVEVDAMFEVK